MTELNERFSNALHTTARSWRLALDRRLRFLGVSQASWMTIAIVAKEPQPLSQSELAERLAVEGATMVAMVDRLVKAGLAARAASSSDRRIRHVLLTATGLALYEKVRLEAAAYRQELLSQIEPARLLAAAETLERLQEIVETRT
jgi:MarR family transcriptional regulator, transcriptional regulator for hemolysin